MYILRTLSDNPGFAKAGQDVPLSQREFMLLVILFVDVRRHYPRDEIARLIWHGSELRAARHSLAQALHSLRKVAPELQLRVAENHIAFDASAVLTDVAAFEKAASEKNYRAAAAVYVAPFLDRRPTISNPFLDEWCDGVRDRLTASWQFLLEQTMENERTSGNWGLVLETTEQLLKLNQTAAGWHRAKIEALYMRGDLTRAVDAITTLRLQCGDDPDIDRTVEELEERLSSQPSSIRPFVGREPEMRALIETWQRCAHSKAETTVVIGEAGIGKTTLVNQFLRYAAIKGARTVIVNCDRRNRHAPYATILDLIQSISSHARRTTEAKALIREIRAGRRPDRGVSDISAVRERVADALYEYLQRARSTVPQCLLLDDADHADASSIAVLAEIQNTSPTHAVHLIMTTRRGSKRRVSDMIALFRPRVSAIDLGELSRDDALRFLSLLKFSDPTGSQSAAVIASAGGHPLYLTSLASSVRDHTLGKDHSVELTEHIKERIVGLSGHEKAVLFALAFSPDQPGFAHIRAATTLGEEEVLAAVEVLEERRLAIVEPNRIRLAHDLFRDIAERIASPLRTSLYHRRLAKYLAERGSEPSLVAYHYEKSGERETAARFLIVAIRRACRLLAVPEAEGLLKRLLSTHPPADIERRAKRLIGHLYFDTRWFDKAATTFASISDVPTPSVTLKLRLAKIAASLPTARISETTAALHEVAADALALGAHSTFVDALVSLSKVLLHSDSNDVLKTVAGQLQACIDQVELPAVQRVEAQMISGQLLSFAGALAQGRALISAALADPLMRTDWRVEVRANCAMGMLHLFESNYVDAVECYGSAIERCSAEGAEEWRLDLLNNYGVALWGVGNIAGADTAFRELADARSRRRGLESAVATANLAQMWYDVGDIENAHLFATKVLAEGGIELGRVAMVAWSVIGLIAMQNGSSAAVEGAYYSVRKLWSKFSQPRPPACVTLFVVRYFRMKGSLDEALNEVNTALASTDDDFRTQLEAERDLIVTARS